MSVAPVVPLGLRLMPSIRPHIAIRVHSRSGLPKLAFLIARGCDA